MTTLSFLPAGLKRPFFLRKEIDRLLTASTVFSCTLVLLRILHTGSSLFASLIWNLFLAYLPYLLSVWLTTKQQRRPVLLILSLVWLLFIPNTFYIVTDLFHLNDRNHPHVPEWYDLILIFSFAWNGLLLGVLSVRQMEKLLVPATPAAWATPSASATSSRPAALARRAALFLYPVMALNALGVYIGRYLRYNSWDIVCNPFELSADILRLILHPLRFQSAWGMIGCYTILLLFIYRMLKKMSLALD